LRCLETLFGLGFVLEAEHLRLQLRLGLERSKSATISSICCNVCNFAVMEENHQLGDRKRKLFSCVKPPTLLQAASDICKIFGIDGKETNSDAGLCTDYK